MAAPRGSLGGNLDRIVDVGVDLDGNDATLGLDRIGVGVDQNRIVLQLGHGNLTRLAALARHAQQTLAGRIGRILVHGQIDVRTLGHAGTRNGGRVAHPVAARRVELPSQGHVRIDADAELAAGRCHLVAVLVGLDHHAALLADGHLARLAAAHEGVDHAAGLVAGVLVDGEVHLGTRRALRHIGAAPLLPAGQPPVAAALDRHRELGAGGRERLLFAARDLNPVGHLGRYRRFGILLAAAGQQHRRRCKRYHHSFHCSKYAFRYQSLP